MVLDSRANRDHHAPPAAQATEEGETGDEVSGAVEATEEGDTGDEVSGTLENGNHKVPLPVEATEATGEGEVGDEVSGDAESTEVGEIGDEVSDTQENGNRQPAEAVEEGDAGEETMEGVASIALLPSGAISGHFIRLPDSICYGLHGTPISCERECSRGEDYRLIKLTIIDFKIKREKVIVVESEAMMLLDYKMLTICMAGKMILLVWFRRNMETKKSCFLSIVRH